MKKLLTLALLCAPLFAARTTVSDTIYVYDGTAFTGKITISAPALTTAASATVAASQQTYTVTNGVFTADLEPTDTATPTGLTYRVTYIGTKSRYVEFWSVPTSASPLKISAVRVSTSPDLVVALNQLQTVGATKGSTICFGTTWTPLTVGTDGYVVTADSTSACGVKWAAPAGGGSSWGTIPGTLGNQTDLAAALAAKAALSHVHSGADITSGLIPIARVATGTPDGTKFVSDAGTLLVPPGGAGNVVGTSGAGAPVASCTAPVRYLDTTNQDEWFCSATNTWKKALSTANSGATGITGVNGTAPATPATGSTKAYFDQTAKLLQTVDDTGAKGTMVRAATCAGGSAFTAIDASGVTTCTSFASGGGSDGAWIAPTLQNSWTVVSGTSVGYRKMANGLVYLRGQIIGGTRTDGTLLFTLPVGFRPPFLVQVYIWGPAQVSGWAGYGAQAVIDTDGTVKLYSLSNTASAWGIDNIQFSITP